MITLCKVLLNRTILGNRNQCIQFYLIYKRVVAIQFEKVQTPKDKTLKRQFKTK